MSAELWLHVFTAVEVAEVQAAIDHFLALDLPFSAISRETFPLTVLKPVFHQAVLDIHQGIGLRVFRGLPVTSYDRKVSPHLQVSDHLGSPSLTS